MATDDVHALAARVEATVGEGFDPKVSVRRAQPVCESGDQVRAGCTLHP